MSSTGKIAGSKISVLHITESSGGVQTFLKSFLRYRDRSAFRHALMAPPDSAVFRQAKDIFDVAYSLPMEREITPFKDLRAILQLAKFLRKNPFDVLHVHSSKAGLIGRLGGWLGGHRRVIFQPHGFSFLLFEGSRAKYARFWEQFAGKHFTSALVATSFSEGSRAQQDARISPQKVVVIPNGVDCEQLQAVADQRTENPETGFVLMAARLMRSKNPMMFARVANLISKRKPTARFILIGTGYHDEFQAPMQEFIRKNGLEGVLKVLPWMEYEKMLDYIKRCSVYASTSVSECFGYAVVESMFFEKPVVGTMIDGTKDIVVQDETGLLVPSNDDEAMADRILHLLESRMLREVYGSLGKKRVQDLFDAKKNVTLLERLYKKLVNSA